MYQIATIRQTGQRVVICQGKVYNSVLDAMWENNREAYYAFRNKCLTKLQRLLIVLVLIMGVCSANCYAAPTTSAKPQIEKVNPKTDQNPIVGEVTVAGKTYKVRKGAKGGLYYWKQKASGENKGEWYKVYVKAEKLQKK